METKSSKMDLKNSPSISTRSERRHQRRRTQDTQSVVDDGDAKTEKGELQTLASQGITENRNPWRAQNGLYDQTAYRSRQDDPHKALLALRMKTSPSKNSPIQMRCTSSL